MLPSNIQRQNFAADGKYDHTIQELTKGEFTIGMLFLAFNVVFASMFTLIIKWVQVRKQEDVVSVGAVNYIVAAIAIVPVFYANNSEVVSFGAVWTGATMGVCYFIAYFIVIHAIKRVGVSSSTVVGVLSILFPIVCGIIIWNETPSPAQAIGVVLALVALSLIGGQRNPTVSGERSPYTPLILVAFFLLAGMARLTQDAFKHVSDPDQRPTFLFSAFVIAAAPSLVVLVMKRRLSMMELAMGIAMGLANILQTYFILLALQRFEGFVVFPVVSAGSLILTTIVATRLLGERLSRPTYIGIGVAVVALVLLNWDPSG